QPTKILRMRPHRGWSLGLMPRTETPPLFRRAEPGKLRAGSISRAASNLAANAGPTRVRACARENGKSVLAIKLGPKAGCWLKAPDFSSPLPILPGAGVL